MELDHNLIEKSVTQSVFLSDNYLNKPAMKDEFFFEAEPASSSSKGTNFLQDFRNFDQLHANGSSFNPMFGVQTGSNFGSLDAFPYGHSSNMELYDYECKPFAESSHNNGNGGHVQVMDNFQNEGYLMNLSQRNYNPGEMMGSSDIFQEIKPVKFFVPDEVSCTLTANNNDDQCHRKKAGDGKNDRVLPSTKRTWKGRKKNNVVKGQWTIDEDRLLTRLVEQYGIRKWSHIAQMLPGRIGKQCRERWHNHLRPDIKKDIWSQEEDKILIQAHAEIGNKWAEIAKRLPGRTENSIKNHWNATKRRQYSKRKCKSKYPRGSLLQDYIKSLNLDSCPGRYNGQAKNFAGATDQDHAIAVSTTALNSATKLSQDNQQNPRVQFEFIQTDRLVPNYGFNEMPTDWDFDEKFMFQEGCGFDSLLDEIHNDHHHAVVDEKSFEMDVTPLMMDFEVKKEMDLMEMISHAKM